MTQEYAAARIERRAPHLWVPHGFVHNDYQIARSLRFNSADSAYLSRTFSGAPDSTTKQTFVFRVKRGALGTQQLLLGGYDGVSSTASFISFESDNTFAVDLGGSAANLMKTTAVFRDPTAWYDIHLWLDTSQASAGDRYGLTINGKSYTLSGTMVQNAGQFLRGNANNKIGTVWNHSIAFYNGLLADVHAIDGLKVPYTDFGQIAPVTGVWVPKQYTGSYGTNGFHLDFSDNSNTTSSTLGKDRSGNNNDFTPNNLSVAAGPGNDNLTDTPTNYGTDTGAGGEVRGNYCVLHPLGGGVVTLSNGGLSVSGAGSGALGTLGMTSGKWAWEATIVAIGTGVPWIGIQPTGLGTVQSAAGARSYKSDGNKATDASASAYGASYTTNDVIRVEYNADTGALEFFKNNTSQGVAFTGLTGHWLPWVIIVGGTGTQIDFNFGQRPSTNSPTSGFKALCTQNLSDPAVKKLSNEFVQVIDTEANIAATLAAARTGWSAYVDILKNRSNSETWAWRFSHDASNEYAVSSTATRQTARSLSGSDNWVGYSIKVGGAANIKAGSIAHTNGVATTITHNAGNARALIFLFPRAGGDVYVYHPDCAAGELLKLNSNAGAATSTVITNVTANAFDIGSGHASGDYDYLVIPESDIFSLRKHTGNGSADGAFSNNNNSSDWLLTKGASASENWIVYDRVRNPYNVVTQALVLELANSEFTNTYLDLLSNGVKLRNGATASNVSGLIYVTAAFGTPFKYARAA